MHSATSVEDLAQKITNLIKNTLQLRPNPKSKLDTRVEKFLEELHKQFFDGRISISSELWEKLRGTEFFLSNILEYIKNHLRNIFLHRDTEFVYNEIEFALFLLGTSNEIDVVIDIQSRTNSLSD